MGLLQITLNAPRLYGPSWPAWQRRRRWFAKIPSVRLSARQRCARRRTSAQTLSVADGREPLLARQAAPQNRAARARRTSRRLAPQCRLRQTRTRHYRSEEHTSELQSLTNIVCRLLL